MTEPKPYADRLKDEVDAFFRLWKEKRWLAVVFLVLLFSGSVYLLVGWFHRGSTIDDLKTVNRDQRTEISDLRRDLRSLESENKGLRETVAPLIARAAREFPGEEINESLKKVVATLDTLDPLTKPLTSVSADVQVRVRTENPENGHDLAYGSYLAFGKGSTSLLAISSTDSYKRRVSTNEVVYHAMLSLAQSDQPAFGQPITDLSSTEYLQIFFKWMPKGSKVLGGTVTCTFNASVVVKCDIPPQTMTSDAVFVRNMTTVAEQLKARGKR